MYVCIYVHISLAMSYTKGVVRCVFAHKHLHACVHGLIYESLVPRVCIIIITMQSISRAEFLRIYKFLFK